MPRFRTNTVTKHVSRMLADPVYNISGIYKISNYDWDVLKGGEYEVTFMSSKRIQVDIPQGVQNLGTITRLFEEQIAAHHILGDDL